MLGHLGHMCGGFAARNLALDIAVIISMSSAILEICFQALKLATLSALPVPMLRQVYDEA